MSQSEKVEVEKPYKRKCHVQTTYVYFPIAKIYNPCELPDSNWPPCLSSSRSSSDRCARSCRCSSSSRSSTR